MGHIVGKTALGVALAFSALASGGCITRMDFDDEDSGPQSKREVNFSGFTSIKADGSMDVTFTIGESESIVAEGNEDRVANFEANVKDGVLILKEKSSGLFGGRGKLHVTITAPSLEGYTLNGSGDAKISGLDTESLSITVNGSGDVSVSGSATKLTVTVNGSGDVDAKGLKAKDVSTKVSGSGDIVVSAADLLKAQLVGSGDIEYFGDPKVTQSVTGSGEVNKG